MRRRAHRRRPRPTTTNLSRTSHMTAEHATDIDYIDHTVLITTDIAAASARYEALGFTLSPLSPHHLAERPGGPLLPTCTANRCAYFGQSFIELLGIVDPAAPDPWGVHRLRRTYRGLLMTLGSREIQATAERLRTAGLASTGIRALEREVSTPDGPRTVRADSVRIDAAHTPEGALQATQHFTPQYVHQPHHLDHPTVPSACTAFCWSCPTTKSTTTKSATPASWTPTCGSTAPSACSRYGTAGWRSFRGPRSATSSPATRCRACLCWPPTPSPCAT
ncbi:hypothetical protein GBF35_01825 [Nonomuraea phyllanthi]|nr:hypothetical protein GBF35_01825 [Nonomuraea phyllanthi]